MKMSFLINIKNGEILEKHMYLTFYPLELDFFALQQTPMARRPWGRQCGETKTDNGESS